MIGRAGFLGLLWVSASLAQYVPPGGGGVGAVNVVANVQGPATSSGAIDITSLGLTAATLNTIGSWCYTGTGFAGGLVTGNLTQLACSLTSRSTSAVTVTFASSSNVLIVLNSNGGAGPRGPSGADGQSVTATVEPSGVNCTAGGVKYTSTSGVNYVCHGTNGSNGANGTNGSAGQSVTSVAEAAGVNCANGGVKYTSASGINYVCNGSGGSASPPTPEIPSGTIDGSNRSFTLSSAPTVVLLFRNGLAQSTTTDYTVSGSTITFAVGATPQSGDALSALYWSSGGGGGGGLVLSTLTNGQLLSLTNGQLLAMGN